MLDPFSRYVRGKQYQKQGRRSPMAEVGYLGSLQSKGIGTENSTQHLCQAMGEDLQQGQAFPHEARQRNKHPLEHQCVIVCLAYSASASSCITSASVNHDVLLTPFRPSRRWFRYVNGVWRTSHRRCRCVMFMALGLPDDVVFGHHGSSVLLLLHHPHLISSHRGTSPARPWLAPSIPP